MMVSLGQHIGFLVSPQNWEPHARARTRTHLAAALSHQHGLLAKHRTLISKVECSPSPEPSLTFTPAIKDRRL